MLHACIRLEKKIGMCNKMVVFKRGKHECFSVKDEKAALIGIFLYLWDVAVSILCLWCTFSNLCPVGHRFRERW